MRKANNTVYDGDDWNNPQMMLQTFNTCILEAAVRGEVDLNKLAAKVLEGRGQLTPALAIAAATTPLELEQAVEALLTKHNGPELADMSYDEAAAMPGISEALRHGLNSAVAAWDAMVD